ncbi:PEP/pyruvate-binding domain-containing protein [Desulfosporosinus sp.]|uniref:PEP/pyruvate-binding domain-containing protein n=1 Tax=Desulfosporosinus sp. TaxID=157907 RepID=UPI0025C00D91|nr:PEP/pyruvate-binding domain-containing protein [Desulfosporosinus sp.]MBC2722563.1 phosphoenolpyruvate synthase [Desulfosporosinus sp.]MBC2726614.1 phosphoenolpyruvate synthase [Desulfosporosinus sp.]
MENSQKASTGFTALDDVIQHLRMGDNVVFQVRDIDVYKRFVKSFIEENKVNAKKIIYICFTQNAPLIKTMDEVEVFSVDANNGFEEFCFQIHEKITQEGQDVFYIFDCLSELLDGWATDSMIGNFFKVTCPYLYELNTIAYFATFKNHNSYHSTAVIRDTTQVLFDVFEIEDKTYVHPLKVWDRYTPTLFLPHVMYQDQFLPITNSGDVAALYSQLGEDDENPERDLDYWDRLFIKAGKLLSSSSSTSAEVKERLRQLSLIFLTRDKKILELIFKYFSLQDILSIKSRLIGSGFIGGKAIGMLLARKILTQSAGTWNRILEPHDSFYIGSDVYYSFLVDNNLWKLKLEQRRSPDLYLEKAAYLRDNILKGRFNESIKNKFLRMLEYFGQSPIIVRSSSLLEDGFGNAFPGKYESVFCINQGTLEERYHNFTEAVRKVFASTLSEEALAYREKHGLTKTEEQMALLVQRVSGSNKQNYFFPDLAGVGFSHNMYVWDSQMNPHAGMIRLVLGLGTRAVDRLEGDYARIAALDRPQSMPYDGLRSFKAFSQQKMDVLDIRGNRQECLAIQNLMDQQIDLHQTKIAERDLETEQRMKQLGLNRKESWVFSFNPLFSETDFASTFSKLLRTLETAYNHPVDIEFTVNFKNNGKYRINLLQCRPLQVQGFKDHVESPQEIPPDRILFKSKGHFMGGNISTNIHKVILVEPHAYNQLSQSEKYETARIIGRLNKQIHKETTNVLLLGPGRWGSKIPSLGVPAAFAEINHISILGEIGYHQTGFLPDVSFGTHFFQDMIESEIVYLALFPEKKETIYQLDLLDNFAQISLDIVPEKSNLREALKVYDLVPSQLNLQVISDITKQEIQCFFY